MSAPVYDVLLVLHVLAAVGGFGALAISGLEASSGRRSADPASDERLRRFFRPGIDWPARLIYVVPLLGLALLFGGDRSQAGHAWPWIGLGLWLVATGVASGVGWPAERWAQESLAAEPADLERFRAACGRMERAAALTTVVFVLAVAVMIVQPG